MTVVMDVFAGVLATGTVLLLVLFVPALTVARRREMRRKRGDDPAVRESEGK